MKIIELLENIQMPSDKARGELPFDLKDDLEFFMRNDDDFYRRHYYPHVVKCKRFIESGKKIDPKMFENLVKHAYECYSKKFPIRELPDKLEENMCEKICQHLHTEESKHIKNKVY